MSPSVSRSTVKPSPRACLSCRARHVRCDGASPKCKRCTESGNECVYVQSKRGMKRNFTEATGVDASTRPTECFETTPVPNSLHNSSTVQPNDNHLQTLDQSSHESASEETRSISRNYEGDDSGQADRLIKTYYQTIHPAHPFLIPYSFYLQNPTIFPDHLLHAISYIASHYTSDEPESYRGRVNRVFNTDTPSDGFKVQTLLLLTLTSYARFERDVGNKALTAAMDLALKINLNSDHYASGQNTVLQESWRRTWWELFTISGLLSLVNGSNRFLPLPSDMMLPTHDDQYESCVINSVGTNADMQQRFLSEDTVSWSSLAYRIEATRILNNALTLTATIAPDDEVDAVKASIVSFQLSLPKEKAEGLKRNGEVDEVMSCAIMIIHLASIRLHLERSDLGRVHGLATVCGNDRIKGLSTTEGRAHRTICLRSAKALANLTAMRSSFQTISPCFSCAIAFAAVVQLAECRLEQPTQAQYLKEQLQMQLSALKLLGGVWPIANVVRGQLAQFSREIFPTRSAMPRTNTIQDSVAEELWMQELLTEDFQIPLGGFSIPGMESNLFE